MFYDVFLPDQLSPQQAVSVVLEEDNNFDIDLRNINFPVQAVMLVTSVKQADTSLRASENTYRRTDLRTSLNIYRVQSLVASYVQQIVSQF